MNLILRLSLLATTSITQPSPVGLTNACECPQVKCPAYDADLLCNCLNNREQLCRKHCPLYKPTYLPCPTQYNSTTPLVLPPQPTATAACECEGTFCAQVWPDSCYCANAGKQSCYKKCGGPKPSLQSCPAYSSTSLITMPTTTSLPPIYQPTSLPPIYVTTSTSSPTIKTTKTSSIYPMATHGECGGIRANSYQCAPGYICMDDPFSSGCGLACDQAGICVDSTICGGFAGFACPYEAQVCVDNPLDDCDPTNGDNDCAGVCVWPHKDGYDYDGQPL